MALPKEPRQKMINIMYLVLTAILALNVSSEILNAFKTIDESFVASNDGLKKRSTDYISAFDNEENQQFANKVAIWKPRAEKVKELSDKAFDFIEGLKTELKKESGQKNANDPFKEDDLEASTRLFLNGPEGQTRGDQLYNLMNKYKTDILGIDDTLAKENALPDFIRIPKSSNKDNEAQYAQMKPAQQWANSYFHMTPTIASIAILSKFQNDIRNTQTQLIEYCYRKINSTVLKLPEFGVVASPSATLVMAGDELTITAGLGAYNKDAKPVVTIDGANVALGADGQAIYKMTTSTPGEFTKRVSITYSDPESGEQKTKSTDVKYKVGIPTGLAVSADATRYFYAGGDAAPNPITVSGSAGGAGAIKVVAGENVARVDNIGPGRYNIICTRTGMATINVSDGKSTQQLKIKVKPLPDPKFAYAAGALTPSTGRGGDVSVANFKDCYGLKAVLPDDFEFVQVKYDVKSFKMTFTGKGFNGFESTVCNSSSFSNAQSLIDRCVAGSSVQISSIVVQDNASGIHELPNTIGFNLR
jgi:gliding motility-associated protein GldM